MHFELTNILYLFRKYFAISFLINGLLKNFLSCTNDKSAVARVVGFGEAILANSPKIDFAFNNILILSWILIAFQHATSVKIIATFVALNFAF